MPDLEEPMSRGHGCIVACLLIGWASAAASAPRAPKLENEEGQARVERALADVTSRDALDRFTGVPAEVWVSSGPGTELCEWRLGKRDPGWAALATAIGSDDRINLLCDLPSDGAPRGRGACSVHPRRTNRAKWVMPRGIDSKGARASGESKRQARQRYRQIASAALAEAGTLVELSRLVGAAPDQCTERASQDRVCLWRTTSHTWGHGTLVMSIGAPKRKKVRMECRLPSDGRRRASDSCRVEVGA